MNETKILLKVKIEGKIGKGRPKSRWKDCGIGCFGGIERREVAEVSI